MKALTFSCLAHLVKYLAISKRLAGVQSAAISSSSGSRVTGERECFMRPTVSMRVGHLPSNGPNGGKNLLTTMGCAQYEQ